MRYHVTVDGQTIVVELVERGGRTFAVADGREVEVELHPIRTGAYSLLIGTRSAPVIASGANDDLTLTFGAETWRCSVQDEREALAAAAIGARTGGRGGGLVRAVMPGIVREVLVRPGDRVRKGMPLLILEAMKMQNEVRADGDGTVREVHAKAGVAVARGDVLVAVG